MNFDDDDRDSDRERPEPRKAARNETLISVTSEGGTALAEETMRRAASALAAGVRRGVPFLGRRRATAVPGAPTAVKASEFGRNLQEPVYVCSL
ncbi:MAG: hypothetical protein FJ096_12550, partial [Deltaproteobacteria bacterium]|nr:hypothetical protein [Deltaproteobacteria bacterium]